MIIEVFRPKCKTWHRIIMDDCDFDRVWNLGPWYVDSSKGGYYAKKSTRIGVKKGVIRIHHFIMGCIGVIDHINGNGLDNRRENLRVCTASDNCRNRRPRKGKTGRRPSRYKGVSWTGTSKRCWRADVSIRVDGKKVRLTGACFETELEAALHYNEVAKPHFGEFALLNDLVRV